MGYQRTMPRETRQKIANALRGRKLQPSHIKAISDGVKKAWERVPLDPNHPQGKDIYLNVQTDNNGNKKFYTDNGTEIKNEI